jgi:hypothetical protein
MYQKIDQQIWVAGCYQHSHFKPLKFRWGKREIKINTINLTSDFRDGMIKKRYYSVTAGRDLFRLEFNRESEIWLLKEIWVE